MRLWYDGENGFQGIRQIVNSLIFVPAVKDLISGAPGTFVSCYLQMFYVSFIFPWMIKHFEKT